MNLLHKIGCAAGFTAMLFGIELMVFEAMDKEAAFHNRINQERAAKAKMTDDEFIAGLITYKYAPELMADREGK